MRLCLGTSAVLVSFFVLGCHSGGSTGAADGGDAGADAGGEAGAGGLGTMTTAHRTSGIAPLSVFFDAVDTTPSGSDSPFPWQTGVFQPTDYEGTLYQWDFGDSNSGTWNVTGRSKNTATGYTAAHVYEAPGTYTARLSITDASGTVRTYAQTITVSEFSGTTFYVAANGGDTNAGRSTEAPFLTLERAMQEVGTNVQILLRRGDSFSANRSWAITAPGPGIIGAYGTGGQPIIHCAELGEANIFSPQGAGRDWRIMDLEMIGPGTTTDTGPVGPPPIAQAVDSLFLRLKLTSWQVGLGWGDWTPIYATPHDGMFVVDSEIVAPGAYGMYVGGRRLALLGNNVHEPGGTHVTRVWQAHKAAISNNRFWKPGGQRHALKLHGPSQNDGRPATSWVTISDNLMGASETSQWTVSIGPQDGISDEAVSHVVYERNRHSGSASLVADVEGSSTFTLLRNNVFDGTGAGGYTGILWHRRGIEPVPHDFRAFNNTFYKGNAGNETVGLDIGAEVTSVQVRNNLLATPAGGQATLVSGTGTGWVVDHNLTTDAPGFANASNGVFSLLGGSPAANTGATLPEVREDFARTARPVGSAYDIGAFESQ